MKRRYINLIILAMIVSPIAAYFIFNPDWDLDGMPNINDILPLGDAYLVVICDFVNFTDPIDPMSSYDGEPYIYLTIWDEVNQSGSDWIGSTYSSERFDDIGRMYIDVDDNKSQNLIYFTITLYDEDSWDFDDLCDISINGTSLDLIYNISSGRWTGEDDDGISSGEDDGSTGDNDDAEIHYKVRFGIGLDATIYNYTPVIIPAFLVGLSLMIYFVLKASISQQNLKS